MCAAPRQSTPRTILPKPSLVAIAACAAAASARGNVRSTTGVSAPDSTSGTTWRANVRVDLDLLAERPPAQLRAEHGQPLAQQERRGRARRACRPAARRARSAPAAPRTPGPRRDSRRRRARAPRRRRARRWRAGRRRRTCRPRRQSRDPCPACAARASLAAVRAVPERPRRQRARDLHGRRADAAADGVDQHGLAGAEPGLRDHGVPGGDERLGDRRRVGERERIGHARHGVGVRDQLLGVGAAADDAEDAIARLPGAHAGARPRRSRRRTPAPESAAAHPAAPDRGPCAAAGRRGSPPWRARARALRRRPGSGVGTSRQ